MLIYHIVRSMHETILLNKWSSLQSGLNFKEIHKQNTDRLTNQSLKMRQESLRIIEDRWTELCAGAHWSVSGEISEVLRRCEMRDERCENFSLLHCGAPCSALRRLIELEILIHFN